MVISNVYTALSTNRHSHSAHALTSSYVAFGSGNLVAIWNAADGSDQGVSATLSGHDGLVTSVRFASEEILLSADDGGMLFSWKRDASSKWTLSSKKKAHQHAIACIAVHRECVVTGSSDSSVKIWQLLSGELRELQIINLSGRFPLALALAYLPQSEALLLAIGGTDRNLQLWIQWDQKFNLATSLAGHEDWIRGLTFRSRFSDDKPLVLASGSQDSTIRLWKIEKLERTELQERAPADNVFSDELLDAFEASLGDLEEGEEGGRQITLKRHVLTVKSGAHSSERFSVVFDALLVGHEAGITSLSWADGEASKSTPSLLSTSTDSSAIIWAPSSSVMSGLESDDKNSVWVNQERFGDVGGQRLGGFVGGLFTQYGDRILAWGWSGGWRCWTKQGGPWTETPAVSGHMGPVKSVAWSPEGEYLVSVGLDQTTRIHAPCRLDKDLSSTEAWHEISRPQVHGYDLLAAEFLGNLKLISVADEKVARVFEAPRIFVDTVEALHVTSFSEEERIRPSAANVPPLGLSNKAVRIEGDQNSPSYIKRRPFEGELASFTLWPESEKIFGHGYESIALGVSSSRKLVATTCKATTPEHAVIRIYDASTWLAVGDPLTGHSLTITRFPGIELGDSTEATLRQGSALMRCFGNKAEDNQIGFHLVAADKSHGRIIWDCAWAREGDVFATASRDKTVKIWSLGKGDSSWKAVQTLKMPDAATAVDISASHGGRRILAVGLENGQIILYSNDSVDKQVWTLEDSGHSWNGHVKQVNRLAWRPGRHSEDEYLASCGDDGALRVFLYKHTKTS